MLIKTYDETARPGEHLLHVDVDKELLSTIEKLLGNMKKESRQVLKNAVNATAKQARAVLIARTKEEYTVKKGPLTKATRIEKRATASTPEAAITVKGPALELREFKTTAPKSGAKAKILTSSTLKTIQSQKGSRAKAYPQILPPKDARSEDDPFPYIEVRLQKGGVETPTDPHKVTVLLFIGIYDDGTRDFREKPPLDGEWDDRNYGAVAVMEIIERIQEHYEKRPALANGNFYFDGPFYWEV